MNRLLLSAAAVAALFLTTERSHAQAFVAGDNILGIGIGAGGSYSAYRSYSATSPVFLAHFEHALGVKAGPGVIGAGAFFGYKTVSYHYDIYGPYYYDYRWNYIQFGARASYHWNEWHGIDKLDMYAGVLAGVNIVTRSDDSNYPYSNYGYLGTSGSGFRHDVFAGARWYFSDGFAAWGELGYGMANIAVGLNFKF
ncbi:MAG: hypothetical protein WAU70_00215 [Flavobacteriales bacterium]